MRFLYLFLLVFLTAGLTAQTPAGSGAVPAKVRSLEKTPVAFPALHPFHSAIPPERLETIPEVKQDAWGLVPDGEVLAWVLQARPDYLEVHLPHYLKGSVVLRVYRVETGAPGAQVRYSDGTVDMGLPGVHYRGMVRDEDASLVSLSFFEAQVMGFVSDSQGNRVLGPFEPRQAEDIHIFYNDRTIAAYNPFQCAMEDDVPEPGAHFDTEDHGLRGPGDCVRIWWEVDHDIVNNKGGGAGATNWITGMAAQVYTLYANESLNMGTSVINVWTVPSPYTGNNSSARLSSFQNLNGVLDGDLAHYVNLTSSYGGIAAGFNGICNPNYDASMCYSGLNTTYNNVPTYSWTIMVCTHEKGHLLGSRHTHACVWNGNNTAIDGCSGFTEGNCPLPGQPQGGGTIMSYCHQNVGINFNLGFGPQPGNVIRNTIDNAACLGDCDDPQGPCTFNINCPANTTVQCGPNPLPGVSGQATVTITSGSCNPVITYSDNNSGLNGCNGTGNLLRTWTAADGGTSKTCLQTITKIDNTPPVINGVPANISINCNAPIPGIPVVTATDNCGAATLTFQESTSGSSCGYILTRTWTATDACNNVAVRSQVISVVDTSPPIALCKSGTVSLGASGQGLIVPAMVDNNSYDVCSTISLAVQPTMVTCAQLGQVNVTLTVTDACGNTATCTATVMVLDALAPKVQCKDIDVAIDPAGGPVFVGWQDVDNGSSDNCGIQSWELSSTSFDCSQLGKNKVTLTAWDASGNSGECQFEVVVRDLTPPVFVEMPEDITVYCVEPKAEELPWVEDNCGEVGFLVDDTPHYWAGGPEGSYRVWRRWTAMDKAGNTSEAGQWITVLAEGELAVLCTPDVFTAASRAPVQAWWEAPIVSDVCLGNQPMKHIAGPVPGDYFNPGSRTRIVYEHIDDAGVRHQCAFHVIVPLLGSDYQVQMYAPEVACADFQLSLCTGSNLPGSVGASLQWTIQGSKLPMSFGENGDVVWEVFADGSGRLRGSWSGVAGNPGGWTADIYLYHRRNAAGWQAVGGKVRNPLQAAGMPDWTFMEVDPERSVLVGTGSNAGQVLQVRSSIVYDRHGLQAGMGANGETSGSGLWLAFSGFNAAGKLAGQGEFKLVTSCAQTGVVPDAGLVTALQGQPLNASWSNGVNGLALGAVTPGTYAVTVTPPGAPGGVHAFVVKAPTGCVPLWQDACREQNRTAGGTATQGSTAQGGVAARAIDGKTDGDWSAGSVSSTLQGWQNFWQVRLKQAYAISGIRIWPRTDCCSDQLDQYYVFVSADPIPDLSPEALLRHPGVTGIVHRGRMNEAWTTPVEVTGQYVRIQLMGAGQLQLAEVEVLVCQPDRLDPPSGLVVASGFSDGNRPSKGLGQVDLEVWPNPAADQVDLRLDNPEGGPALLSLRNLQGQLIWSREVNEAGLVLLQLSVADWPQGMYFLSVDTAGGRETRMLAVQR